MRKQITGTDGRYLLFLVAFCAGVPHLVLGLLQMDCVSAFLSPFAVEGYANFFVCQWIPFWLTFLSYLRLQKTDRASLIPAMCAAVIVLTYLPRFAQRSLGAIALTIPLILLTELSGLLKKADMKNPACENRHGQGYYILYGQILDPFALFDHISAKDTLDKVCGQADGIQRQNRNIGKPT